MKTVHFPNEYSFQQFQQLEIQLEPEEQLVRLNLNSFPRPSVTPQLVSEIRIFQTTLENSKGRLYYQGKDVDVKYHVLASKIPGVFSLGGDLSLFLQHIKNRNRSGMASYARSCIDGIYPFIVNYNLPIATISLLQGDALGGGLEIALSSDIVIAERSVNMGFPEILFNLFPGMGAYHLLAKRISPALADKIISSGNIYSAQEMYDMGIVDILADDGEGEDALRSYIKNRNRHWNGHLAMDSAKKIINPITYEKLMDVCDIWIDAAMNLSEKDLSVIKRLVRAQERKIEQREELTREVALA